MPDSSRAVRGDRERVLLVLVCLAGVSTAGCDRRPIGYFYEPDVSGTVTYEAASGETTEYRIGEDCWGGEYMIYANPPNWGATPNVSCSRSLEIPSLTWADRDDLETAVDWPDPSLEHIGSVHEGPGAAVPLDVTVSVSEGTVLDIPEDGEPVPVDGDPAATPDYARTFRIRGDLTCAEVDLECDGTFRYDATFELGPESVSWVFPTYE